MMTDYSKKLIEIKDYLKKDVELARLGKTKERELVLLEGLKKYPNEIQLKKILLEVYFALYIRDTTNDYYKDLVEQTALELKNNENTKFFAIEILAYLYRRLDRVEEIKDDVLSLPTIWQSKTLLRPEVLKWEERIKAVQENFIVVINLFDHLLLSTYGREEVGKRDEILLKEKVIIDAIFENKDYGMLNHQLYNIYYRCARDQAYIKNKDKVIIYLNEMIKYAKEYDEIRFNNKIVNHTSFLVDRLVDSACDYIYSDEQALLKNMQEELQDKLFYFIREDEDIKQIFERLNKV